MLPRRRRRLPPAAIPRLRPRPGLGAGVGCRGPLRPGDHHARIAHAVPLDQREQFAGMTGVEPHATVRRRRAEPAGGGAAVDGVPPLGEKDRIRHRRIVPLARSVVARHPERPERTGRRCVAAAPGRNRPTPALDTVDRDPHALGRLVDRDDNGGLGRRADGCLRRGARRRRSVSERLRAGRNIGRDRSQRAGRCIDRRERQRAGRCPRTIRGRHGREGAVDDGAGIRRITGRLTGEGPRRGRRTNRG